MGGTTGVSLEHGLGLTDVPRGCPGRRPGDERSYAPDYYFIIYKINPSARDPRARLFPGSWLGPYGAWNLEPGRQTEQKTPETPGVFFD